MWIAISVWKKNNIWNPASSMQLFFQMNTLGIPQKLSNECVPRCRISTGYAVNGGKLSIFPIIQRTIKNSVLKTSSHDRKDSSDRWNVCVHFARKLRPVVIRGNYWSSGVLELFKPSIQLTYKYFKRTNSLNNL